MMVSLSLLGMDRYELNMSLRYWDRDVSFNMLFSMTLRISYEDPLTVRVRTEFLLLCRLSVLIYVLIILSARSAASLSLIAVMPVRSCLIFESRFSLSCL